MKYLNKKILTRLTSFFLLMSLPTTLIAEQFTARLSGHWSPKHQSAIHSQLFADEVTKRSNGRLKIDFYPSKQLFGIREVLGAVTSGAVELGGIVGVVSFPSINKNFNVASFPGLFNSYEQQRGFFSRFQHGKKYLVRYY
jgi:TRAP-type C4-dicarboxylate transport system substrate-binding protein